MVSHKSRARAGFKKLRRKKGNLMERYYKIAGLTVKMESFGKTERQATPYLSTKTESVDVEVKSRWKDRGKEYPGMSEETLEYLDSGRIFYKHLLEYDGFMLHASAVVVDGKAYLFSADSGTGKSTHTRLWLKEFSDRAYILNDDKPALRLVDGIWYAYGTPWSGKYDISANAAVPVAGVAMLQRGEKNEICQWKDIMTVSALLKQVNRPRAKEYREKLLVLLDSFMEMVPIWKLICNMDNDAARISYEAMSQDERKGVRNE